MIEIDIKGSCVTREAFNLKEHNFKVRNYWFQKPLVTLMSEPINISEDDKMTLKLDLLNKNYKPFMIKKVFASLDKEYFSDYTPADYFILDLVDERLALIKVSDSYMEYDRNLWELLKNKDDAKIIKNDFELWKEYFDKLMTKLSKYYTLEKIILHKSWARWDTCIKDKNYDICMFNDSQHGKINEDLSQNRARYQNLFLLKCYEYITKKYPEMKVIEIPLRKYYCDIDHRLMKSFYHFEEEYYRNFLLELKNIIEEKDKKETFEISEENNRLIFTDKDTSKVSIRESKFSNGIVNTREHFENEKIIKREIFEDNGNKIEELIYNGQSLYEHKLYLNNTINRLYVYTNNGELYKYKEFYNNSLEKREIIYGEFSIIGKPYSEINYNEEGKKEKFIRYYSNGNKYAETVYLPAGILKETIYYDNKENIMNKKIYHLGVVVKELQYLDKKVNKITEYFDTGEQMRIKKYNKEGHVIEFLERKSKNEDYIDILDNE